MDNDTLIDQLPGASEALRALARRGVVKVYAKGRLLIEEGDLGDTLFIILSGQVRVFASDNKRHEITYGSYKPGDYVGEMSLDGGPRAASVETLGRCVCVVVARRTLEAFITERPDFAFELIAKLIRRARAATLSARQMALNDVYGRLKGLLESQATGQDAAGTRVIQPRPTHLGIARQIGCSREMVSRLMKDLERGGHVAVDRDALHLLRVLPARW